MSRFELKIHKIEQNRLNLNGSEHLPSFKSGKFVEKIKLKEKEMKLYLKGFEHIFGTFFYEIIFFWKKKKERREIQFECRSPKAEV